MKCAVNNSAHVSLIKEAHQRAQPDKKVVDRSGTELAKRRFEGNAARNWRNREGLAVIKP